GWNVVFVVNGGANAERLGEVTSVDVRGVEMARDPSPIADARSLVKWIDIVRSLRPLAVWVGTPKASLLGVTAAWLLRVPVRVYFVHGIRAETTRGRLRWLLTIIERWIVARSTHVVAVSSSVAVRMRELGMDP